ncbi:MAG: 2-oxoglutarate dehydrogenase E1 [Chloroflexi bacterium]|nr:2-oxoglutarate dehydrogenase E1 [Chloroflexota bacterium]
MARNVPVEADDSLMTKGDEADRVDRIKCLTLLQPWASLVALNARKIETRSWRTWYRGPLLIHAARAFPRWARDACKQEPFAKVLAEAGYTHPTSGQVDPAQLPLGMILAVCNLKHCVRIGTPGIDLPPSEQERSFGDYSAGRYAWVLSDVQPLPKPIAAHGSMGLWEPDENVLALLQLGSTQQDSSYQLFHHTQA